MIRTVSADINGRINHLAALRKRHRELSEKIDQARVHASVSDFYVNDLKRQKLHLKDLIENFGADSQTDTMARA